LQIRWKNDCSRLMVGVDVLALQVGALRVLNFPRTRPGSAATAERPARYFGD
jgi:hypothetical protein